MTLAGTVLQQFQIPQLELFQSKVANAMDSNGNLGIIDSNLQAVDVWLKEVDAM